MFIVFIRAILLYCLIIFSMRLMGKRQIGEMQPSDLVTTILISNMAALPIEDINIPMLVSAIPILAITGSEIIMSNLTLKSKKFRHFITGKPIIVIRNGVIDQRAMNKLRVNIDDIHEAMRGNNIFDIQDVHYAIVETNGTISFLQKFSKQNATPEMLDIKGADSSPPQIIISDGRIINEGLESTGLGGGWLETTLKENKITASRVFLMTADENAKYFIIPKEEKAS